MGELTDAAGARHSMQITVDGKTWQLSPITLGDFAELESWMEMLPLTNIKPHLDGLQADERKMLLEQAYQDCKPGSISLSSPEAARAMQSLRGVRLLLFFSLRKMHPDITVDQASSIARIDNLEEMHDIIARLSGLDDGGDDSADPTQESIGQKSSAGLLESSGGNQIKS